jgi:phosphocarrier protein FPr
VSSVEDARAAADAGADLAGLVRTEFLFVGRSRPPDAEEQAAVYRAVAEAMPGRRIVVRTLDVGGDKPLDYVPRPPESNPFLGVRGLRLALARPRLLADQLLAVVRAAHDHPLDVMFPMVTTLGELLAARGMLDDAVRVDRRPPPAGLRVGIMVEVPATALKARVFAPHVDFFSIGTNDLTQYALAAERGNDAVAALADPLDPGVLRLVAETARAQVPVAVCGELAADENATGLLLGLGVRELSVAPGAVPQVKQAVREVDLSRAAELAREALTAPDAGAVRALLGRGHAAG